MGKKKVNINKDSFNEINKCLLEYDRTGIKNLDDETKLFLYSTLGCDGYLEKRVLSNQMFDFYSRNPANLNKKNSIAFVKEINNLEFTITTCICTILITRAHTIEEKYSNRYAQMAYRLMVEFYYDLGLIPPKVRVFAMGAKDRVVKKIEEYYYYCLVKRDQME